MAGDGAGTGKDRRLQRSAARRGRVHDWQARASGNCNIKGNRSRRGDWIYHVPGMPIYDPDQPKRFSAPRPRRRLRAIAGESSVSEGGCHEIEAAALLLSVGLHQAALASDLEELARDGYAVVIETNVDGEFEGCDFDNASVQNGMIFVCSEYSYTYSYMPDVLILKKRPFWRHQGHH
jgi:hypothetical protein